MRVLSLAVIFIVSLLPVFGQIKILPLGNSITQGTSTHFTYRYNLWEKLKNENVQIDFVGTLSSNYGGNPEFPDPAFDKNHEGHRGWRADQLLASLPTWLGHYTPDIALLHIGTNDVFMGNTNSSTAEEIKMIIDVLRNDNPRVTILLAKIIGTSQSVEMNQKIIDLNNLIAGIVPTKNTATSRVILVDQYTGLDPVADCYDGKHPNEAGEEKMAQKWFQAIVNYLQESDHTPPTTPSQLSSANVTPTSATLSWIKSTDATGIKKYAVYNNGQFVKESTTTSVSLTGLSPNTSYSLTVKAIDVVGNQSNSSNALLVNTPAEANEHGIHASYFNNQYFSGNPTLTRTDAALNFSWGTGFPAAGINNNYFSIRWTGFVEAPVTGPYTFFTTSDDGIRLWIDDVLMIENWKPHSTTTNASQTINLIQGQRYAVRVDFYEASGGATAKLLWSHQGVTKQPIPTTSLFLHDNTSGQDTQAPTIPQNLITSAPTPNTISLRWNASTDNIGVTMYEVFRNGTPIGKTSHTDFIAAGLAPSTTYQFSVRAGDAAGNWSNPTGQVSGTTTAASDALPGLVAKYFNTKDLSGPVIVTRHDSQINFDWRYSSPAAGVNTNYFSARWESNLAAPVTGQYVITTQADDGVRVWLNNSLIINNWIDQKVTTKSSNPIALEAGSQNHLVVEYFEGGGSSTVRLLWTPPGKAQEIIPQNVFSIPATSAAAFDSEATIVSDTRLNLLGVYPNPAQSQQATIVFHSSNETEANILIFDAMLAEVYSQSITTLEGENTITLPADLPDGVLTITLFLNGTRQSARLVNRR